MRRAAAALIATVAGLVVLLGFKTHPARSLAAPPAAHAPTNDGTTTAAGTPTPSASTAVPTTHTSRSVTGAVVDTRWGPVQVRVTFSGRHITAVDALQLPNGNPRDQQINGYAVPVLTQEALSAQSAHIDMVSGATYTSQGYIQSLQSALDRANG